MMCLKKPTAHLLAGALLCGVAAAQPVLERFDPVGYQKAEEIELALHGRGLDQLNGILFLSEGFELVEFLPPEENAAQHNVARVRVGPDVRPGIHWLRVRTPAGVSNMEPFSIGDFTVIRETAEANHSPAEAQWIELNHTVEGLITSGDRDHYRVSLDEGQRISIEIEGIRLTNSGLGNAQIFDPSITVLAADGDEFTELAFAGYSHLFRQDPYLLFKAPRQGDYVIEVRDVTFRGHPNGRYRLHVGEFIRPAITLPLGAPAGEPTVFKFIEDDGTVHEQLATLTDDGSGTDQLFFEKNGLRPQTGNPVRVSPHANIMADGSNRGRDQAMVVEAGPPVALNGVLAEPGQEAWFQVTFEKGTKLSLNVVARPLGSPLDSTLEVLNAEGRGLEFNDDAQGGNPDSSINFEVPEDGLYFIRLRDQLLRGGPTYAYRIEIDHESSAIALSNPQFQQNNTHYRQFLTVPQGGYGAILMTVSRTRLADEVEFVLPDLPPGLEIISGPVPSGLNSYPLIVRATGDVPLGGWFTAPDVRAVSDETPGFSTSYRQPFNYVTSGPGLTVHHSATVHGLAMAVTEAPPFRVRLMAPEVPLVRNGMVNLPVQIDRDEGYTNPMKLFMLWRPNGMATLDEVNLAEGETSAVFELSANENAAVGDWQLVVLAEGTSDGGNLYAATEPVGVSVVESYLSASTEMTVIPQGSAGELVLKVEAQREHDGEVTFHVINAPNGVTFEAVTVAHGAEEVIIPFQTSEESPIGRHGSLFVRAEIHGEQGAMVQQVARDTVLRIDRPQPAAAPAAAPGQRLSRLEQLRQQAGQP